MKKGDIMKRFLSIFIVFVLCFSLLAVSVLAENETDLGEDDFEPEVEETVPDEGDAILDDVVYDEVTEGYSDTKSYSWLENESSKVTDIPSLAMAILALNNKGYPTSDLVTRLVTSSNADAQCWPAGDCRVKETAYALLALKQTGQEVDTGLAWLNESLVAAPMSSGGEWQLVLEFQENGTCDIGLDEANLPTYQLNDNKIGLGTATKFYLTENDLGGFGNEVMPTVYIKCGEGLKSGANLVISLNYAKNVKKIYIVDSSSTSNKEIVIPNACFPNTKGSSSCDYESTLIATWALVEMGQDLEDYGTYLYLETNLNENNALQLGFVTRTLQKALLSGTNIVASYFLNELALNAQYSDSTWGDVYPTAVAIFALSKSQYSDVVLSGKDALKEEWHEVDGGYGYWGPNVHDTAWALLAMEGDLKYSSVPIDAAIFAGTTVENICYDNIDNDANGLTDCDDDNCENTDHCLFCTNTFFDEGEEDTDCGGICPISCDGEITVPLNIETGVIDCHDTLDNDGDGLTDCEDSDCDSECVVSTLPSSCMDDSDCGPGEVCGDGVCVFGSEESSGIGWIIAVIVILLVLGGGGAFFYFYYVKTGKFKFGKKLAGLNSRRVNRPIGSGPVVRPVPSRPMAMPAMRPAPVRPAAKPVMNPVKDDALEKSLKKAEELLYKK